MANQLLKSELLILCKGKMLYQKKEGNKMHGNKYAIVCVLMLLMLTTFSVQIIKPAKAQYTGWDQYWGYASTIQTSAAGNDVPIADYFETGYPMPFNYGEWGANGWDGANGNIAVEYNPRTDYFTGLWSNYDVIASTSAGGQASQMWKYFPSSTYTEVTAEVEFVQQPYVPQGSTTRLELVYLNAGDWTNEVTASVNNPYGTPIWTLETYEGGSVDYNYGIDSPAQNTWYQIDLVRDVSNSMAYLYVDGSLEAEEYRSMAEQTVLAGFGIGYQSDGTSGNTVRVDDINITANGGPVTADENQWVQTATDNIFGLFSGTDSNVNCYGKLENYMINDYSCTTWGDVTGGINEDSNNYPYATFLYIGHTGYSLLGDNQYHYGFMAGGEDGEPWNNIPIVWDYQVTQYQVPTINHYFDFLWVCDDGDELGHYSYPWTVGMPYSWSGGAITSSDGYDFNTADQSNYALISFKDASPMLSTHISFGSEDQNTNADLYKEWLVFFYYAALNGDDVHDALDFASQMCGYNNFAQFPSYNYGNGNWVWWSGGGGQGMGPAWYPSTMEVYGDSYTTIPWW